MKSYIKVSVSGKMKLKIVAGVCGLLLPAGMFAQQAEKDSALIRTVVVEQEYNPNVMDASKINILPEVEEPTVVKRDIEYSNTIIPATSYGAYQELLPFTQQETQPNVKRGYVRLGYGNRGNIDAKANYLYDFSSRDRLGIDFSMDGRNEKLSYEAGDWKSRYYRTKAAIDYLHQFDKTELSITGSFGSDVFTYRNYEEEGGSYEPGGRQHHTKASAGIGLTSRHEDMPLRFKLYADYLYFNKKYIEGIQQTYENGQKNSEHIFRISGDLQGDISDEQVIGLNVNMDNLFYPEWLKNYSTLNLKPYYLYEADSWRAKLGVNVDLGFGYGKSFLVSPDVEGQYNFAENYLLYLNLKGGRVLNDYRHLEILTPYGIMGRDLAILESTYIPLDANLGFKGSPFNGLWFNIFGGYQMRNHDVCAVNNYLSSFSDLYNRFKVDDTRALYLGGKVDYTYKDLFKCSFNATYYNWNADDDLVLLMKPELGIKADIDFRITKGLFFNLGYDYRKYPRVYQEHSTESGLFIIKGQMPEINNLSAKASYYFSNNLSVFVKGNNLLNKDYQYYYSYPAQKISVLGGVSFRF